MGYSWREALKSLSRRRTTNTAAITTITASLFVLSLFVLGTVNLLKILDDLRPKMDMTIFLEDNIGMKSLRELEESIQSSQAIRRYEYVSREQALEEFKLELADTPELFEALDFNPLPASFRVELVDPYRGSEDLTKLASQLEHMDGVEEVRYSERLIERLQKIFRAALILDVILGVAFCLATLYVVGNTIKLLVYDRKDAVEIMKLVGATDSYIRRPFLLVGLIQGALGGIFAGILIFILHLVVKLKVSGIIFPKLEIIGGLVLFGAVLGFLGSLISVRKFLKV